jgi:hypothetical protein
MSKALEYAVTCANIGSVIKKKKGPTEDLRSTLDHIRSTSVSLYEEISVYCDYFRKTTTDFISDCIVMSDGNPEKAFKAAREASVRAVKEVKANLSQSEAQELDRIRDVIGSFLLAQEAESFIFSGITPYGHFHVVDTPFDAINALDKLFKEDWTYVQPQHRKEFEDVLENADPPSRMIAATRLASDLQNCLIVSIQKLLYEELDRWQ